MCVELAIDVVVPENDPVRVVDVGVATEHLLVHILDLVLIALWEARCLADPAIGIFCYTLSSRKLISRGKVAGREDAFVLAFARNPCLDVLHVCRSWQIDRVAVGIDPIVQHTACILASEYVPVCSSNSLPRGHAGTDLLVA